MSQNKSKVKLVSLSGVILLLELLTFYWLGLGTTTLEMLNRELYFTSEFLFPAVLLRLLCYVQVYRWSKASSSRQKVASWTLLMLPVFLWFSYRFVEMLNNESDGGNLAGYFVGYLLVECLVSFTLVWFFILIQRQKSL
jgi:hypothetical protein